MAPHGTREAGSTPEPAMVDDASAHGDLDDVEGEVVEVEAAPMSEEERLRTQLEAAQARLRSVSKAFTELQAEMTAFRGRVEAQSRFKAQRRGFEVVRTFFEPVQNLERSVEAPAESVEDLRAGLQIVLQQFHAGLEKLGLRPVPGLGARFDPTYHEALAVAPVESAEQDGMILHVHVGGFMVGDKCLQAAQVVVGKHEPPPAPVPEAAAEAEADADTPD